MNILKYFCFIIIFLIFTTGYVCSESRTFMLGQAAGSYIAAVDLVDNFEKTECTYLISGHFNVYTTLNEMAPYFNKNQLDELKNYITSNEFKKKSKQNYDMLFNFLDTSRKSNANMDLACRELLQNIEVTYNMAKYNWEFAKTQYSK